MNKLLLSFFFFFCFAFGFSQNVAPSTCDKVKNTYQVLVESPRIKVAIPSSICDIVERERKATTINYYKYDEYVTLKIYPTSQLPTLKKDLPYLIYKGQE